MTRMGDGDGESPRERSERLSRAAESRALYDEAGDLMGYTL
jgi:hypothetical protein